MPSATAGWVNAARAATAVTMISFLMAATLPHLVDKTKQARYFLDVGCYVANELRGENMV
jgi:hypothetical protein